MRYLVSPRRSSQLAAGLLVVAVLAQACGDGGSRRTGPTASVQAKLTVKAPRSVTVGQVLRPGCEGTITVTPPGTSVPITEGTLLINVPVGEVTIQGTIQCGSAILTVHVVGPGQVSGSGISCPGTCTKNFQYESTATQVVNIIPGQTVEVTLVFGGLNPVPVSLGANPGEDAEFIGWSQACGGTGGCNLLMNVNKEVTATFEEQQPPPPPPCEGCCQVECQLTRGGS